MTQNERRIYLIQELLAENPGYKHISIPAEEKGQNDLLRSLMNVHMPRPVSQEFLRIQDEYLQAERDARGVVDSASLPSVPGDPRLILWQGDITTLKADAIVNAANSALLGCFCPCHGCIDNAIHTFAGAELRQECARIMREQGHEEGAGGAKITSAYNLPAKYVLHTVGPIVSGKLTQEHCRLLESCYISCMNLAAQRGLKTLAFCCISTGEFGFPKLPAARIAINCARSFLKEHDIKIIFDVFGEEDYEIYSRLLAERG